MKRTFSFCVLIAWLFTYSTLAQTTNALSKPQPLQAPGIENFFQLTEKIYSGSAPDGEQGFAELQKRGFKTIISVDGSKPDVETAKKFGLRYVHLPIGYDGVPTNQAVRLVKAAETLPGPIFVHCHHGLHRGPAGAAVICMGTENWSPEQAVDWLKQAGTATNYAGLYKSVAAFHPPSAEELGRVSGDFQETVEKSPLVDTMVEIDGRFDNVKLIQKAGFQQPPTHPDLAPAHEALLLDELFKELLRSPESQKRNPDFRTKLAAAQKTADEFYSVLSESPVVKEKAEVAFKNMGDACTACHKVHRN